MSNTPKQDLTVEEKFRKIIELAREPNWQRDLAHCRERLNTIAEYAETFAATPQKPEPSGERDDTAYNRGLEAAALRVDYKARSTWQEGKKPYNESTIKSAYAAALLRNAVSEIRALKTAEPSPTPGDKDVPSGECEHPSLAKRGT